MSKSLFFLLGASLVGAACAAPLADESATEGGSAIAERPNDAPRPSVAGLGGRYEPQASGEGVVLLDLLVARETSDKAMFQGRLIVTPPKVRDEGDYAHGCAFSMSGVLSKPASDGATAVAVEVRTAEGASKGTLSFDARPGLLRSQRLSFAIDGVPAACDRALSPRGDLSKGLAFVRKSALEQGIVGYRTLVRDHRFAGRQNPYAAYTPTGNSPSTNAVPSVDLFAGEPVVVLSKEAPGFRVAVDRIYERGGIGRAVESTTIPFEKLGAQPRDVEAMSALPTN